MDEAALSRCGNSCAPILRLHIGQSAGRRLYVGVTNDLVRRVYVHKMKLVQGHTKRYQIDRLVYFEVYDSPSTAIQREKNMKHWPRVWKTRLIGETNPTWRDLYDEIASP